MTYLLRTTMYTAHWFILFWFYLQRAALQHQYDAKLWVVLIRAKDAFSHLIMMAKLILLVQWITKTPTRDGVPQKLIPMEITFHIKVNTDTADPIAPSMLNNHYPNRIHPSWLPVQLLVEMVEKNADHFQHALLSLLWGIIKFVPKVTEVEVCVAKTSKETHVSQFFLYILIFQN